MTEEAGRQPVETKTSDGLNLIRLDRAAKRNALSRAMYAALSAALRGGEDDDEVAVHLIAGQADVFCAGHDIADFLTVANSSETEREE